MLENILSCYWLIFFLKIINSYVKASIVYTRILGSSLKLSCCEISPVEGDICFLSHSLVLEEDDMLDNVVTVMACRSELNCGDRDVRDIYISTEGLYYGFICFVY